MDWFFSTIAVGFLAFAATNVDDLLFLMVLFSLTDFRRRDIVIGRYVAYIVILTVCALASFSKWVIPLKWMGLLGVVPIIRGIGELSKLLWKQKKTCEVPYVQSDTVPSFARTIFGSLLSPQVYTVAAITIGDGSDNFATYIPLFADGDLAHMGIIIGLILLLVGVLCYIANALASLPPIAGITARCGHILLPFVLMALGIIVMIKTGALVLLRTLLF